MSIPKDIKLSQISSFLYSALTQARMMALKKESQEQIADLLDAVHNLPDFIDKWEKWDEKFFSSMLKKYDDKWVKKTDDLSLLKTWNKFAA